MAKKMVILASIIMLITPCILLSQSKSAFTGDVTKFRDEVKAYMGSNLKPEQIANLNTFLA